MGDNNIETIDLNKPGIIDMDFFIRTGSLFGFSSIFCFTALILKSAKSTESSPARLTISLTDLPIILRLCIYKMTKKI